MSRAQRPDGGGADVQSGLRRAAIHIFFLMVARPDFPCLRFGELVDY